MFVELRVMKSDGDGAVCFNTLPPGSADVAIRNSSSDGISTTLPLPSTGTYGIDLFVT